MQKDYSFLRDLITEDIYYIKSSSQTPLARETAMAPAMEKKAKTDIDSKADIIDYRGENLKEILVLVEEGDHPFLNQRDEAFLTKVLLAVDVSMNDIALVNIAGIDEARINDVGNLPHGLQLCFMESVPGALSQPGLNPYENITHDGKKVLWCDPLQSIAADKALKIKLWQQLKLIFNK